MDNAFKYIEENKGIDTEQSYPYHAKVSLHPGPYFIQFIQLELFPFCCHAYGEYDSDSIKTCQSYQLVSSTTEVLNHWGVMNLLSLRTT